MRSLIALVLAFALPIAACDRQTGDAPQDNVSDGPGGGKPGGIVGGIGGDSYEGSETMGVVSVDARGMAAPDVVISHPDGQDVRLGDFAGQPVLVNLWATWCAPCIAEMPTLDMLAENYRGRLKVMTISENFEGAGIVVPFLARRQFRHLEPWLDPENAMLSALGESALPVTVLYGSDGTELFRVRGGMDWSGERAERLIEGALGG